jgi:hypothetical protein
MIEKPPFLNSTVEGGCYIVMIIIYISIMLYHRIRALRRGDSRGSGDPTKTFGQRHSRIAIRARTACSVALVPIVRSLPPAAAAVIRRHRVFGVMTRRRHVYQGPERSL